MLVIRRKAGECVLIGDDIEIEVIEISSSRIKLGIQAPAEVLILRKEVQQAGLQNLAASRLMSKKAIEELVARLRPGK